MRNTNRKRALLISGAVILLCMSVIVGMTWALFTDTEDLNHHLKAGRLNITLLRTRLTGQELDPQTGYLKEINDTQGTIDFTNTTKNVFGITEATRIVPGSTYTAEMQIINNSDVAFAYWVEIDYKSEQSDAELSEQVEVTLKTDKGDKTVKAKEGLKIGSEEEPIGTIVNTKDKNSATFTVTVLFRSLSNNDLAQGQDVSFDLVVHAVQVQNP